MLDLEERKVQALERQARAQEDIAVSLRVLLARGKINIYI